MRVTLKVTDMCVTVMCQAFNVEVTVPPGTVHASMLLYYQIRLCNYVTFVTEVY